MADREFTNVNGIKVCDQTARDNIPTRTSQLENDSNFITNSEIDLSSYAKKTDLPTKTSQLTNDSGYITNIPDEYITEAELNAKRYASEQYVDDAVNNASISGGYTHPSTHPASMITGLSIVATSGNYNDLTNKPTIPTRTSELTNNSDFVNSAFVSQKIAEASLSGGGVDLSGYALKTELHSHGNKAVIDAITSDMTAKWNKSIPYENSYVSDCDTWLTNGYIKTNEETVHHPSACTGSDRWGVLFYISENAQYGTGTQMYFPIDGAYAGRIFTRKILKRVPGDWNLVSIFNGNYDNLTNKPTIPSKTSQLTNDSNFVNSTYVNNKIAEASLSGGGVDLSGYVTKETGNANQITFADGQTFQAKLNAGTLKGEKGDKGDKGDKGEQGIQGPPGPQGPPGTGGGSNNTTTVDVLSPGYGLDPIPNDSTTCIVDKLQAIIDYASNNFKKATIFIPYLENGYVINKRLLVRENISLKGDNTKIRRTHGRNIDGIAIKLFGNNEITGLDYSGGSDTVQTQDGDFVYYADFDYDNSTGNIKFENNKFNNSLGAYIRGNSSNITIINNSFGQYRDHGIYFGARNWANTVEIPSNIKILNNSLFSTSTRDIIKIRNGAKNCIVANNTFSNSSVFMTIDIGDSNGYYGNSNINISNNVGSCTRFVTMYNFSTNEEVYNEDINICNNIVTCIDTAFILGGFYSGSYKGSSGIPLRRCRISNNKITSSYRLFIINGNDKRYIDGLVIDSNILEYNNTIGGTILGEIKNMYITNNIIKYPNNYYAETAFLSTSTLYDQKATYIPKLNGNFNVFGNTFEGMKAILVDNSSNHTSSLLVLNLNIKNNFMNANGTKQLIDIRGGHENTINSTCVLEGNTYNDLAFTPVAYNKAKIKDDTKIFLQYRKSADQSIGNNAQTVVTFPTFELDDFSSNTSTTNGLKSYSSDGVFTTKITGWYKFKISIQLNNTSASTLCSLGLFKNGTELKNLKYDIVGNSNNSGGIVLVSCDMQVYLQAGDTVDIRYTGGAVTVKANAPRTYIQIIKDN